MFTGIVEELGEIVRVEHGQESARLTVRGPLVLADAGAGSSIAVSGVCLTVVTRDEDSFTADVMLETLRRTVLGDLSAGSAVNLERPLAADGRLSGHIVQGHVDGTGVVRARIHGDRWDVLRIDVPPELSRYLVEKGSVAVDGVSLTVASVIDAPDGPAFTVSLIPETLSRTTLGRHDLGARVNLEVDILAKYIERLFPESPGRSGPV